MKMTAFWDIASGSLVEVEDSEMNIFSIALIMESIRTSETPFYYETSQRHIPEGCHLHIM
jgi:hypothetical protein